MHPTGLPILPAPAASSTRRTAAGVTAERRPPAGLGLDAGEDRRTLTLAGATTQITCIMPKSGPQKVIDREALDRATDLEDSPNYVRDA